MCAVILAAGQSTRMGMDKASLPWSQDELLLTWTARRLRAAGWQPLAVVAPDRFAFWQSQLPEGGVVLNPEPARGKTSSIACGIQAVPPSARWILLSSVDQPRPPGLYLKLRQLAESCAAKILVPDAAGHRGHPVLIDASLREELMNLEETSQGLRGFLDRHAGQTQRVPVMEYRDWDLNTPELYRKALDEAFSSRPA